MSKVTLAALLALAATQPLTAQAPMRIAGPVPGTPALMLREATRTSQRAWPPAVARRAPSRRVLVGAALGAVAGLVTCTAISNIIESEGGFHTCTTKGNAAMGGGGALLGALIAHLTR